MKNLNSKNRISLTLGVAISIYFVCFSFVFASSITADKVIDLTNKDRIAQGLEALKENSTLDKAAAEKAADMIKNNYFAHTSPSGLSPWYWFEKNDYDYTYAGENLAVGFTNSEEEETAWMNSPTHRKNILNSNYKEIGVAMMKGEMDGENTTITVQLFGTKPKGGQSLVKGSTVESSNLDKQLMPEKKAQTFTLPEIANKTGGENGEKSFVGRAADFVQNFDLQKASLILAGLMIAICLLVNMAAIVFVAVNSVASFIFSKEVKNPA
jgi:hypothetical protein